MLENVAEMRPSMQAWHTNCGAENITNIELAGAFESDALIRITLMAVAVKHFDSEGSICNLATLAVHLM